MANDLKMVTIDAIEALHKSGMSNRKIAKQLGVHRDTVAKYVQKLQNPKQAGALTGSDGESPLSPSASSSRCEPHRERIESYLERGLSAKRIHQELEALFEEASPSYHSVRRFVAKLTNQSETPFRRIETEPGEEAQIDFGSGAPILLPGGKRRRTWVFRIVLSHSRKAYSEAVHHQSTEAFLTALENAFHYFGGAPRRLVIDNLKAAVTRADWYDPDIHPKLRAFATHYGAIFLPTKPYTPRHKGKVESGVKYVKDNALKGRSFKSLAEENAFLLYWEEHVADTRIHGTTKRHVAKAFEDERPFLCELPRDRFPCYKEGRRKAHRDGHIEVEKAYYSVPPEYVGRTLWARWDARLVRVYNEHFEQIALHARAEPGRFHTDEAHIPREKFSAVEYGAKRLLERLAWIGPHTKAWSEAMLGARGVEGVRVLVGLKSLAGKHESQSLEEACRVALAHGAFRLRTIRELLKRKKTSEQQTFAFLEDHPIIRPLSDYSLDSLEAFRKERPR